MVGSTMTRAQLSESVYQEVGLSRNESAELVEDVLDAISDMQRVLRRVLVCSGWAAWLRLYSAR